MFIVSKDGFSIREPKQVSMRMEYSKEIEEGAQRIYNDIRRDNATNKLYAPSEIEDFARRKAKEFAQGKETCSIILDREINFGTYDEVQGKIVFEEILAALKNGERFFDMREVAFND